MLTPAEGLRVTFLSTRAQDSLFSRPPGESEPRAAALILDIRVGTLACQSGAVQRDRHAAVHTWSLPPLTASAANRLLMQATPSALAYVAHATYDPSNGSLHADGVAHHAMETITRICDPDGWAGHDLVTEISPAEWFVGGVPPIDVSNPESVRDFAYMESRKVAGGSPVRYLDVADTIRYVETCEYVADVVRDFDGSDMSKHRMSERDEGREALGITRRRQASSPAIRLMPDTGEKEKGDDLLKKKKK